MALPWVRMDTHRAPAERVYLIIWPDHMIVKAGYTAGRRWRDFLRRGAVLCRLVEFGKDWRAALDYERELHSYFTASCSFAFTRRADSEWLLGSLGGWVETYRVNSWAELLNAPRPPFTARLTTADDFYAVGA